MTTEKSSIIRQKIETGAVFENATAQEGASSNHIVAALGQVFTQHFDTKAIVECAFDAAGATGQLVSKNADKGHGYLYRLAGETECIVFLDPAALLTAATWAADGAMPKEPPSDADKISTIDQRLAGLLASKVILGSVADDPSEIGATDDEEIELVAVNADIEQLTLADEKTPAKVFVLNASTIEEVSLGTVTVLLPDALFASDQEVDKATAKANAERKWTQDLAAMVAGTLIDAKAIIAREATDLKTLSDFKPGQILPLRGASLDAVALQPESQIEGPSLALGAVRVHDGLRTMQVSSLDVAGAGKS